MNHYKRALRIMQQGFDADAVALHYAQSHPKEFIEAASGVTYDVEMECKNILRSNRPGCVVEAVKHYRDITGASLKDAKQNIDKLRE